MADVIEHCEIIKASDVEAAIAKGPENFLQVVKEFTHDVRTLVERMQDLYKANKVILGIAGIGVQCKVVTNSGEELADFSFGTIKIEKVNKNELQREVSIQKI